MPEINTGTKLCAVIGNPVEHSLSPAMHNAAYEAAGLDYVYLAFRIENVKGFLTGLKAMPSFRGVSVTIPHKLAVMQFLDHIEPMAARVGSVNTLTHEDGKLVGSTTDGPGTLRAFAEAGVNLSGKRILFTGTGGAVRAVAFAMAEMASPEHLTLLGRTPQNVSALVAEIQEKTGASISGGNLESDITTACAEHDVIVQGTPVGMYPNAGESVVPSQVLRPDHIVFDMVYRPQRTKLIEDAEAAGCQVIYGLEMLANQAELQFERWTATPVPPGIMRQALVEALAQRD
jgi:shikimate dehydrogenase